MAREGDTSQPATVLRQLVRSLSQAVAGFEATADMPRRTFPDYKKARAAYLEIQSMVFAVQDKAQESRAQAPPDLGAWLVRTRLRAIAAFTRVSLFFFRDPPALLVQALGAHEILEMEREAFEGVLKDYDMMLLEASVDDRKADELDKVRTQIEEVVRLLQDLLKTAPPPLATF
ncbi:hypothetical protein [Rhodospirillum centenum]|uniref:Uncharacterized protein n=1 Tax=Rhodospirillum centenum (strain ATCC 51521 / SW) TaxID=414684 RepID=B6IW41_RHOCS|nr:hypothetical protein [Rhodospirillum centenum]ACJ00515.1 hypothetical protein RC1_3150 [Rhodospirillum centenum SW]